MRAKQIITGVRADNGVMTTDQKAINDIFSSFYSKLFTSESTVDVKDLHDFFDSIDMRSLPPEAPIFLEVPIKKTGNSGGNSIHAIQEIFRL